MVEDAELSQLYRHWMRVSHILISTLFQFFHKVKEKNSFGSLLTTTSTCQYPIIRNKSALKLSVFWKQLFLNKNFGVTEFIIFNIFP